MTLLTISFDFEFYPLLIVVAIAWFIPLSMSLLRITKIPTVIIEILAGFFIGKWLLGMYPSDSIILLDFLALTGFVFLMFLGGLEIDMGQIMASFPRRKIAYAKYIQNPLLVGTVYFIITIVTSYGFAWGLSHIVEIQNIWYFSLIMITTSIGIILPVLKSRAEINTHFGQMIILASAIADILSIALFTITAFILRNGLKLELAFLLLLPVLFLILYLIGKVFRNASTFKKITYQLSHAASQIRIRGTILLILVFVVLAQFIGKEVILLGAFMGGLLLSIFLHKDRSMLLVKLDGFGYGFFIPMFFIMVGVHFDPAALGEIDSSLLLFLASLLVAMYIIKIFPSFLWMRLFGMKRAISGGFLMASRLSLIIAASTIGVEMGVISPAINSSFILMAVLTCLISPVIYNYMNPKNAHKSEKTIIVGGTSVGVLLARRLHLHDKSSVIIEKDESRFKDIKTKGLIVFKGDGADPDTYEQINLDPSNYVVVMTGDDQENIRICKMIRKEFSHEKLIARSGTKMIEQTLKNLNVETFDATRILANSIENLIILPTTYHALIESYDDFHIEELEMLNHEVDGLQVREVPLHGDGTIMMIKRGGNMYVPHGDTYLRLGDIINVFGTNAAIEDYREKLS
ncbi:MAG: hypothetical protein GY834_14035 [Bacteroidetes bacterium]|nr:hypothetical protein [Bacteroidota bacterium]